MVLIDLPHAREARHLLILNRKPPVEIARAAAIAHRLRLGKDSEWHEAAILADAEGALATVAATYRAIVGKSAGRLSSEVPPSAALPLTLDAARDGAQTGNPLLLRQRHIADVAAARIERERAERAPFLALNGAYQLKRANPIGSLLQARKSPFILGGLVVLFIAQFALQAQITVWPYYGMANFGWTAMTIGLTTSLYGVLMVLVRILLTKQAVGRMGAAKTARLGILFAIPSYLMLGFAKNIWVVIAAIVIGSIAGVTFPAIQALMSTRVPSDAQGELQGMIASSSALTAIFGPVIMTQVFNSYVGPHGVYLPGAPFLLAALLLAIAAAVLWRLTSQRPNCEVEI